MLDFVRLTQPVEVDCDVCLMHVGEFAEAHVVGKPVPEGLKAMSVARSLNCSAKPS